MDYVNLGPTGLRVSRVCLGMMSYGPTTAGRGRSTRTMPSRSCARGRGRDHVLRHRRCLQRRRKRGDHRAGAARAVRDARGVRGRDQGPRPDDAGRERPRPVAQAHHGLDRRLPKRLELDYVDLYQIHRWDPRTPIAETMDALHDVVKAGKARYIGASSMYAWQFAKARVDRGHAVRLDAEPLQPHLPRGGAGDDPPVPGPGCRRDPVEPARPRDARRQPHARWRAAHGASQHRQLRRLALQA